MAYQQIERGAESRTEEAAPKRAPLRIRPLNRMRLEPRVLVILKQP
jgi:hypothetical protein